MIQNKKKKGAVTVRESVGSRIFTIVNTLILVFLALICILPLINILAFLKLQCRGYGRSCEAGAGGIHTEIL